MAKEKDANRELSLMIKDMVQGTTEELKEMIPKFDLAKPIPDTKIKQAILRLTPAGMERLSAQFGRENVMGFINEFAEGRRW